MDALKTVADAARLGRALGVQLPQRIRRRRRRAAARSRRRRPLGPRGRRRTKFTQRDGLGARRHFRAAAGQVMTPAPRRFRCRHGRLLPAVFEHRAGSSGNRDRCGPARRRLPTASERDPRLIARRCRARVVQQDFRSSVNAGDRVGAVLSRQVSLSDKRGEDRPGRRCMFASRSGTASLLWLWAAAAERGMS